MTCGASGPRTVRTAASATPVPGGPRTVLRRRGAGRPAAGHHPVRLVPGPARRAALRHLPSVRHADPEGGARSSSQPIATARTHSTSGRCEASRDQLSPSSALPYTSPLRLPKYTPAGSASSTDIASRSTTP